MKSRLPSLTDECLMVVLAKTLLPPKESSLILSNYYARTRMDVPGRARALAMKLTE